MKLFISTIFIGIIHVIIAQDSQLIISHNTSCATSQELCYSGVFSDTMHYDVCSSGGALFYSFTIVEQGPIPSYFRLMNNGTNGSGSYIIYGPLESMDCSDIESYSAPMTTGTINGGGYFPQIGGDYIMQIVPDQCFGMIEFYGKNGNFDCSDSISICETCITSFMPTPGKYIVSAWVKEGGNDPHVTNYENASIEISYPGMAGASTLLPKGRIIDGWQRIEEEITVPAGAESIEIKLQTSDGEAYFDDIRFFPTDGSMMSYVYDPASLRLMAELDERNFATLYEYDEEGKLIRVKKETERGIMTIQENRDNIRKN